MSTLKVNTVQHNTSGFNNVVQFTDGAGTQNGTLCRAWVNFNGQGTIAIRASFNVSSLTDQGTGYYDVNFSNSLTDGNYAVSIAVAQSYQCKIGAQANMLSSRVRLEVANNALSTGYDDDMVSATVFR